MGLEEQKTKGCRTNLVMVLKCKVVDWQKMLEKWQTFIEFIIFDLNIFEPMATQLKVSSWLT